jgi:hypothetical protein
MLACVWNWIIEHPWQFILGAIVVLSAIGGLVNWFYSLMKNTRENRAYKKDARKKRIREEIRRLKVEYRKEHQMPGSFLLGADYYIERIKADPDLIREIVRIEGEKER